MRVLTKSEIDDVSGGVGLLGFGLGAAIGFGTSIGRVSTQQVFAATLLGGLSGAAGNFAGSAAMGGLVVRGAWGIRSIGLGVAGGAAATEDDSAS